MNQPYFRFFHQQYLGDTKLAGCSPAAQGVWLRLIAFMYQSRGALVIAGERLGVAQIETIARWFFRQDVEALRAEIEELIAREQIEVADDGTLWSRRVVDETAAAERSAANGRKGGRPNLKLPGIEENNLGVNSSRVPQEKEKEKEYKLERDAQARAENFGTHQKPDAAAPALVASRPVGSRAPEAAVARVGVALGGAEPGGAYPAFPTAEWPHGRFFGAVAGGGPVDAPAVADPTRSPVPAIAFARWFVEAGSAIGAIRCVDQNLQIRRESLEVAATLLTAHGRDECEARAHRLFAAHLSTERQRIIRPPTIAALEAWWDSNQLRPEQRSGSDRRESAPRSLRPIAGGFRAPAKLAQTETGRKLWEQYARVLAERTARATA